MPEDPEKRKKSKRTYWGRTHSKPPEKRSINRQPPETRRQLFLEKHGGEARVSELLSQLSEKDRQILSWFYLEGLTVQEIGKRLNPPVSRQRAGKLKKDADQRLLDKL